MSNEKNKKRVFLSATYEYSEDCIEEIKSKLAELGIKVIHFKEPDFHDGTINIHNHDVCITQVENTPNYLLIVNHRAGSDYQGNNPDYSGLTVTHAEFKAAVQAFNRKRKMYCFVRKKVMDSYNIWKKQGRGDKNDDSWPAELEVYRLLEDMEKEGIWINTFENSLELKKFITKQSESFVND